MTIQSHQTLPSLRSHAGYFSTSAVICLLVTLISREPAPYIYLRRFVSSGVNVYLHSLHSLQSHFYIT